MPTFTRNGFSTYYEESGSGDPVVFISGLSADLQVWRFQVPEISKTHRVIVYDNRGAGRSDAPDEPYAIAQMAQDLDSLLEHLNVRHAAIVGWSMGGVIAQTLALECPDRVGRLLLLGTFTAPDGYLKAALSSLVSIRRSSMAYEDYVRHLARSVYSPALLNNPEVHERVIQLMLSNPYRQSKHGFIRQATALLAYNAPKRLASLEIPIVVFVGQDDQLTPPYLSQELVATMPRASLKILPAAHSGFVERPAEWTAALQSVLQGGCQAG